MDLYQVCLNYAPGAQNAGLPQALEIIENLENHQKSSMHGKIMEFQKKPEQSWKNHGIL